jgi:NAD(P)-dependent dehydrogenase (short-subunit alcohol dehydrogenase family)
MTRQARKKTMLVTGGSRGIGAAVAKLAASRGYEVAVNYKTQADAAQAGCDDITASGGHAFSVQAEVADAHAIEALFKTCEEHWPQLDVLVNNAGVVDRSIRFDTIDAERIRRLLQINVAGAMLCAREAVRRMSTRLGGHGGIIVNISSIASLLGSPNEYIDYAASKAAIDTLTIGLAREVANEGIRVNAVRPGIIDTDIHASGGEPGRAERVAPTVPMQRAGTPLEVAYAVLWLASPESAYVTGSFLNVSGGRQ